MHRFLTLLSAAGVTAAMLLAPGSGMAAPGPEDKTPPAGTVVPQAGEPDSQGSSAAAIPVDSGENLTPESAVALALANHPSLRAAQSEVAAAEADKRTARSGYLPRLDLTEDYARSTNPVYVFASKLGQQIFGPQDFAISSLTEPDPFTNAATRLVLRQNIWDADRTRLGNRAAKLGIAAASDGENRAREEVSFGAVKAFWDAVLADEMLQVTHAAEEAARANRDLAANQEEAGLAVPSDRMSAEVRLSEVQAMRIRAEQGVRVARAALRQALGLSEDRDFALSPPRVKASGPTEAEDETEEGRVSEALSSRPDLRALGTRIQQAEMGEKIARSHYVPEVGLGAQMEWNDETPFGRSGDNWTVGASLRFPIFDGLETQSRIQRARSDKEKLAAYRDSMTEGIRLEVRTAWADRVSASERLKVAESALGQAEEALRVVKERYAEGMAVMVELLGAEAARTSAQGNKAAATRDLALARAALDLATGRSIAAAQEAPAAR
jgi:outer membrane protein